MRLRHYYFILASLPALHFKERPEISFEELMFRLQLNMHKKDLAQVQVLRRFVDMNNIRALLMEEQIDSRGNLSEKELDEALLVRTSLPDYVFDFLDQFERNADKLRHFFGLISRFFNEEIATSKGFIRQYLEFERQARLVLVGLRAKQLKRDVVKELQFEDPTDPFVAQILAQKDAESYDPPMEFQDLKEIIRSCGSDPWLENRAFAEYRFGKISEMSERKMFSADAVFSYMAQLMIVEDYFELDEDRGNRILETFKNG